jgi:rhamnogalacturonyl hydrolase YesR
LVSVWRLTGDRRALAAARGIADALISRVDKARNPRQFGWPMLALIAVFDATGEQRYLKAARSYPERGTATFRPSPAQGDFKMGILADGVAAVHQVTDDEQLLRWLVDYAESLLADPQGFTDARYSLPLAYVAAVTGEERYARAARSAAARIKIGRWGKPFTAMARAGFRLLSPLGKASQR